MLGERYPITIERASVDEVYLDLTAQCHALLSGADPMKLIADKSPGLKACCVIAGQDTDELRMTKKMIRDGHSNQGTEQAQASWFDQGMWSLEDLLLICGAELARQLRQDVFTQLGFTCSAGIAHNKMLSKLASGMHKPNKQTLVPRNAVAAVLKDLPFSRIQGFGGKLGTQLSDRFENVTTLNDLLSLPKGALSNAFGDETARWILQKARGEDDDPVADRALPISIGCSKSFRSTNTLLPAHLADGTVLHWLTELAQELVTRMETDEADHSRKAKQLHVGLSVRLLDPTMIGKRPRQQGDWWAEAGLSLSKVVRLPAKLCPESIATLALSLVHKALNENPRVQALRQASSSSQVWGITSLGLSATQFDQMVSGRGSIAAFLKPVAVASGTAVVDSNYGEQDDLLWMDGDECSRWNDENSNLPVLVEQNTGNDADHVRAADAGDPTSSSTSSSATSAPTLLAQGRRQLMSQGVDMESFSALPPDIQQELLNASYFGSVSENGGAISASKNKKQKTAGTGITSWLAKK